MTEVAAAGASRELVLLTACECDEVEPTIAGVDVFRLVAADAGAGDVIRLTRRWKLDSRGDAPGGVGVEVLLLSSGDCGRPMLAGLGCRAVCIK